MAVTSLAEQLKKLAVPQTSILVHTKKKESLLFDPKDAADIDRATFYKIGLSGLEELKQIDPRLAEFEKSLFDETSLHLERAVEDQQANAKLDKLINRFLILISPYLNLKAAHKALEWLICRFHIHKYNMDSVVALILPYHDTNIFARMVQLLPLQDKGGRWVWLQPLKKEGIPMSKLFLLSRVSSDPSFLKFVCSLPLQGVQVHGERSGCLTTLFAFYCTTVIGGLDQAPQVSELQVTHLLPSLLAGINSSHLDFMASAYMILGHLVSKVRLTPSVFSELFYKVARSDQTRLHNEAALVLVVMAQTGHTPSLLPSVLHLATTPWFLPTLTQLAGSGVVVFPLVAAFVSDSLVALKNPQNTQKELLQDFVSKLLQKLSFNEVEAGKLLKLFAEAPLSSSQWYQATLHHLEKCYPQVFDSAVRTHPGLSGLVPGHTAHNDVFLRLNHPEPKLRREAVQYVMANKELLKEASIQEALLTRLTDDNTKVVAAVLSVASSLPNAQLADQLISLATHCWHSGSGRYTLGPSVLGHLQAIRPTDQCLVLLLTLPFLLPSSEKHLVTAKAVLSCGAVKHTQILQPLATKLKGDLTEKSLSKAVFLFLQKGLKNVNVEDVLKAGLKLESAGSVYHLITMLVSAGALSDQVSSATVTSVLQYLTDHNNPSIVSSEVDEKFSESNLCAMVSVCRSGKLPFQGGLHVLSQLLTKVKPQLPVGRHWCDVREPQLAVLVHMFTLLLRMKKSNNQKVRKAYTKLCNEMFEKCCRDTAAQVDFLSNIALGYPELAADCMSLITGLVEEADSVRETVLVPAMLVALHSADLDTRQHTLTLLQCLTRRLALPTYHRLLDCLAQHDQEIAVDHEQVIVVLYMSLSPDPSVQALLTKSERQDMASVLQSFMDIIISPDTPTYITSALLRTLDQINSQSLLESLIPVGLRALQREERTADEVSVLQAVIRRVTVTTAGAFHTHQLWHFVEACLREQKPQVDASIPAVLLLQQIDREMFAALPAELQQRLLGLIVSCVVETEQSDVTSSAASCFKRVAVDAAVVAKLLEPMRDATLDPGTPGTKKKAWTVRKAPPLELLTSTPWKQGLCLLEFIQNKKKLDNVQLLLPRLFEILNRCLQFEEQSPVEYTKQVLLTALLHCCVKLSPDGRVVALPEASVQVELVVECVRVSSNPQTHHHALLLLAHIANMISDRVLHSIMPIFTFMGSSVLRQDDAYSFQIISKIIETVVPVLMKSKTERPELTAEVVGVLRVFAGALLDIPEHRRTPLFTKLLTTLYQGHFLWAFLSLVFESHVLHPGSAAGKEAGSIPARLEVGLQLCHQFPPSTVLSTCSHLIHYLNAVPVHKDDKQVDAFKRGRWAGLFDVERASDKQLRHYTYTTLTFLSLLLSSKQFLRLMAELTVEETQDLKEIFQQMFEGILSYIQTVSKQVDSTAGQPTAKYWKSMFNVCFDVLAKTNSLLPADMFLSVIVSLLNHHLVSLRCKALELLNWRLQQARPLDSAHLLALLPSLLALIKDNTHPDTQQTALLSVKFLARQLASEHPSHFQPVLKAATKLVKKTAVQEPVLASAVLCVGELSHTLGAHAIASLPSFMPPIIAILQNHQLNTSGDLLMLSVVSALHKVVDSLACFLSPYLDQLIQQMCRLSADCSPHSDNPRLQPLLNKITNIRQKLSGDVPLRVLLPAVAQSYSQLVTSHTAAVLPLLSLLADSFKSGQVLTPELSAFFLSALDFRSQALSQADVALVEPAVISAIVALVFKLSESSFRPFYYKIFNWAFRSDACKDRSITFYKLTCSIAESLKGLFVSFAHYWLKNAAGLLDDNHRPKRALSWSQSQAIQLVEAVLQALYTVLLHDASHFVNKERFETLMQPLVDQLENELGGVDVMERRTSELVIPCLTQVAVSAADDSLWKQLNYQILLKTRHNLPQVRIGGVLAVCEIAKKLGEEFLPLLPETVPFLAELLEDEDENVEKTSRRVVQELEAALGEPISKYF